MLVLEHEDGIIIVDCGVGFPEAEQLGIDLLLPNISYLRDRRDRILAVFCTHGHEDHIGALPYLLPELDAPVFATKLTLGLVRAKLSETGYLNQADLREISPDAEEPIRLGPFSLEPFRVTHSIPDCVGFAIDTPAGLFVHTGDFKIDPTPIDDRPFDLDALARYGARGVRLLISDCTNIESSGHSLSERVVGETYEGIFADANGRIIIATFASLIARVQQVIDVATRHRRRVAVLGRSMAANVDIALELGFLSDPRSVLLDPKQAASVEPGRLVYLVTGSQGEPMSVLSRIASGEHRDISIADGDTVIVSATPIPGNEAAVYRTINSLFRQGAEVIYSARALVHVSGHGSWDEISRIVELTSPAHCLPFHGEHRMLALYAELAAQHGLGSDQVTIAEAGDVIRVTPTVVEKTGRVPAGPVYVDGGSVGDVGDVVIRDRQALADEGIVMVVVTIDRETGEIVAGP
jgi:ribonuclease J